MPVKCCDLTNKIAVVTGASRGIGKAIAIKLATYGAKIILVARNTSDLKSVSDLIISQNGNAKIFPADVSKFDDFSNIISDTLER